MLAELPDKAAVLDHLDRAAESIAENIVNGNSQWSADAKCRYFDIARGSALEGAACLDICHVKGLVGLARCRQEKKQLQSIVRMIAGLIRSQQDRVCEPPEEYDITTGKDNQEVYFDHEQLDVYQFALDFVRWFESEIRDADFGVRRTKKLDNLSTSIALNIAEGNGRSRESDHRNFLDIAHRSALKAALQLDLIRAKAPQSLSTTEEGKGMLSSIVRMLLAMRARIQASEGDKERDKEGSGVGWHDVRRSFPSRPSCKKLPTAPPTTPAPALRSVLRSRRLATRFRTSTARTGRGRNRRGSLC
jgi:four helix bundle protein